jgi:LuxR family transcriptional regulator, maltose regulon positive regulatory protein
MDTDEREVMAKVAKHALIWAPERDAYELREPESASPRMLESEGEHWFAWLATHSSFAFQGIHGHLTLQREARSRGEGYWYAYRSQHSRTFKRYVGRTTDMTIARLEATANALTRQASETCPEPDAPAEGKDGTLPRRLDRASPLKGTRAVSGIGIADGAAALPVSQRPLLLLGSKLHLPRLPAPLISRKRLLAQLDAAHARKLTLLTAPAGYGKTTLVRQWVADREACAHESGSHYLPPLAWVALDGGDNDPARFWSYIITACQTFRAGIGQAALALLHASKPPPFEPSPLEMVLTTFLNELAQGPTSGMLVLDDYQVITAPRVHETLAFLLEHLPATLHLVIMSRSDPALPLARLRASGDLVELRAADLRFSQEETRAFLQLATALRLPEETIRRIDARLDGWATGLRLLALTLRGRTAYQEIEHLLATFAGSHRSLQDYFVAEVLASQSEPLQLFLLQTSVLTRFTGSLCHAVTGSHDSERLLEALEREGLFLEPLDDSGQWYRYHALFAESMEAEARRRMGEDALRALSLLASRWYEQHDLLGEAVEAALRALDAERAAGLIERLTGDQHFREVHEFHTLCRWLEQIPTAVMRAHPALCLSYATALLFISLSDRPDPAALARIENALQMAEQGWQRSGSTPRLGEVFALRSLVAHQEGETERSVASARQALARLPAEELPWRSVCLIIEGEAALHRGELNLARRTLQEARALCEATGNRYFTRATITMLGEVYYAQGELQRAAEHFRLVLEQAREREDLDDICHALLGLAQLSYEWNDLQGAWGAAQETLDLGELLAHEAHRAQATILLARVLHARGQTAQAEQQLASLLARMRPARPPLLFRKVEAVQVRLRLAVGDLAAVHRWVASRDQREEGLPAAHQEGEKLLVARWLLAQGEAREALNLLTRLLPAARQAGRTRSELEIQALMTLSHVAMKQVQEARQRLRAALSLARGGGYIRLFLDEGETLATVLRAAASHLRERPLIAYLQTILLAFAQEQPEQAIRSHSVPSDASKLVEPLSRQEQRVLRLLASGRSNPEIARELIVSVNTVRSQVQSIYRKLGVNNRVAASEMSRRLQLL